MVLLCILILRDLFEGEFEMKEKFIGALKRNFKIIGLGVLMIIVAILWAITTIAIIPSPGDMLLLQALGSIWLGFAILWGGIMLVNYIASIVSPQQ